MRYGYFWYGTRYGLSGTDIFGTVRGTDNAVRIFFGTVRCTDFLVRIIRTGTDIFFGPVRGTSKIFKNLKDIFFPISEFKKHRN